MAWITPNSDTIKRSLLGAEYNALRSVSLGPGQTAASVEAAAIADTVTQMRGYVAVKYALGTAGTIPDELALTFGVIWRYHFLTRVPNNKLLDDNRTAAYKDGLSQLKDVANGKFIIVPPETPAPDNQQGGGPGIQLVNPGRPQSDLSGLI